MAFLLLNISILLSWPYHYRRKHCIIDIQFVYPPILSSADTLYIFAFSQMLLNGHDKYNKSYRVLCCLVDAFLREVFNFPCLKEGFFLAKFKFVVRVVVVKK